MMKLKILTATVLFAVMLTLSGCCNCPQETNSPGEIASKELPSDDDVLIRKIRDYFEKDGIRYCLVDYIAITMLDCDSGETTILYKSTQNTVHYLRETDNAVFFVSGNDIYRYMPSNDKLEMVFSAQNIHHFFPISDTEIAWGETTGELRLVNPEDDLFEGDYYAQSIREYCRNIETGETAVFDSDEYFRSLYAEQSYDLDEN